ncbi:MAG TPA: diguanylate cyclase, partial [Patescibacteria group bacterium]|nr:diguanylate cyclase [Patescibacteria group bacterium]
RLSRQEVIALQKWPLTLFIGIEIIFLLLPWPAMASHDIVFLETRLNAASGSDRLDVLHRLIPAYLTRQPAKALAYSQESLQLAQQLEDNSRLITALLWCGQSYNALQQPRLAIEYFFRALAQAQYIQDQFQEAIILNSIGNHYFNLAQYDQAAQYFLQSLNLRNSTGDHFGASKCLNNLGRVYDKLKQFDRAIDYFQQSLDLKQQVTDPSGTVFTLNNLGLSHRSNGNPVQARGYFLEALQRAQQNQSLMELGYTTNNLGELAADEGQFHVALEHFFQALEYYAQEHNVSGETYARLNISKAYRPLGNLQAAIEHCNRAVILAQQLQQSELLKEGTLHLSRLYEDAGDPGQALQYLKQHNEIREKLLNETVHEKIVALQLAYDQESRSREIELLKKESQLQTLELGRRQQVIYSIGTLLLMCCITVYVMKTQVSAREARERELLAIKIKLEESNRNLHTLSETDPLTGLANRRRFDKSLQWECHSAWDNQLDLSMIMIDVDYFKLYNDSYGHHRGDLCLQAIAHSLTQTLAGETALIARFGGEEFAIILLNTSLEKAIQLADQARQAIANLNLLHEKAPLHGKVTASFGASSLRTSGYRPQDLVRNADQALYRAKDLGRNQVST